MKKLLFVFTVLVFTSSCMVNRVYAPINQDVTLGKIDQTMEVTVEKKQWYALWGLVPITNDRTAEIIDDYGFDEVKVESKVTFIDGLIGIFTGLVSIVPATVVVEGTNTDGQ